MIEPKHIVLATILISISSTAVSQPVESGLQNELGENVLSYEFDIRGLPSEDSEFQRPDEIDHQYGYSGMEDGEEGFDITEDEALSIARKELESNEWELDDSYRSRGVYEFRFVKEDSNAQIVIDGSSKEIVEFDAETGWVPKINDSSVILTGFINFDGTSSELEVDSTLDDDTIIFDVKIKESTGDTSPKTTVKFRGEQEVGPGQYDGIIRFHRNGEIVHTEGRRIRVPGEPDEEDQEDLEEMSREELMNEVISLRERVDSLRSQTSNTDNEGSVENESSDNQGGQQEKSNKPGFIGSLLSGLFG